MKTAIICFSDLGEETAEKIASSLEYSKVYKSRELTNLKDLVGEMFENYTHIVFICAVGITVRLIAPYIKDKTIDPAVVAVDDMGRYAISLLSGHVGGANEFALKISEILGAEAIITTASDSRGIEAVDMFAKRCNLAIEDMGTAKAITCIMVNGGGIGFVSEIKEKINYFNILEDNYKGCICVTSRENVEFSKPCCILRPRNLVVGIGCRRGKSKDEILNAISIVLKKHNLSMKCINSICSIDIKKDENGIIESCEYLNCKFITYSKEEIQSVQDKFKKSSFVNSKIGVTSVCEPSVYLASEDMIVGKTVFNGITVAVGRKV